MPKLRKVPLGWPAAGVEYQRDPKGSAFDSSTFRQIIDATAQSVGGEMQIADTICVVAKRAVSAAIGSVF